MANPIRRGPVAVRTRTSPKAAKRTSKANSQLTFGCYDHQVPWRQGELWRGVGMRPGLQQDEDWFDGHPDRRMRIRRMQPGESATPSLFNDAWVVVLRSPHDGSWNTVSFPFCQGIEAWDDPKSDEAVLDNVGRVNPRVMMDVKLLSISPRYISRVFSRFDYGARGE